MSDDPQKFVDSADDTVSEQVSHILEPPPDGGLTAWLQVVAGFFCMFNSWGLVNTYGVYQEYYRNNLLANKSSSDISWIGALFGALAMFMSVVFAPLVDRGYIKILAVVATICQTFALMMLSLCKEYYQVMLTQAVLLGIGASMFYLVGISAVTPYFHKHRGLATGIAAAGSSIGGVIYPIGLSRLLTEVGFAWSARIVGFISLATGLLAFVCIKRRLPPRKRGGLVDITSFKDMPMLLYSICLLFAYSQYYMVNFYIQTYSVDHSNGKAAAQYTTAIVNAASTFGRIAPNFLSDRIGVFNVMIPAVFMCMVLAFCWIAMNDFGSSITLAVLYGLSSAPFIALQGPIVAKLTPDLRRFGIRLAFTFVFSGVGALLGSPMAGLVLTNCGWLWVKVLTGCCGAVSLLFALWARSIVAKGKIFAKV